MRVLTHARRRTVCLTRLTADGDRLAHLAHAAFGGMLVTLEHLNGLEMLIVKQGFKSTHLAIRYVQLAK
jgi:hypothetical protein